MFNLHHPYIAYSVTQPNFGYQDLGISTEGASDRLSFDIAYMLLGKPKKFSCNEIIYTQSVEFTKNSIFCITGAHYQSITLNDKEIKHSKVYQAQIGDILKLKVKTKGFRTYLIASDIEANRIGIEFDDFKKYFYRDTQTIRVIKGAEFDYINNPIELFNTYFKISNDSNKMGLKLKSKIIKAKKYDIISSATTDGTVQLTKDGPIVLMRDRQTTGGYPRILQVISIDIDKLAQYKIGELIKFELISLDEAKELMVKHKNQLNRLNDFYLKDTKCDIF
jgi:allophanate hydrolase subunit 2